MIYSIKSKSGSGVDPEISELAVQGRVADSEASRDLGHAATVMADREADDVAFDGLERAQIAIFGARGRRRARRTGPGRGLAALILGAKSVRRLVKRDWTAMCGKSSAARDPVAALQCPARNKIPGKLADIARPAIAHQHRKCVVVDGEIADPALVPPRA